MYRTVTRLLGLSGASREVRGSVSTEPEEVAVLDHAASLRRTGEGSHLAVTVRVRNDGPTARPVPVSVRFYRARWLGLREAPLEPVSRATDRLEPGKTGTVEVGIRVVGSVVRYELLVGSGT